jgi:hypothetical protein
VETVTRLTEIRTVTTSRGNVRYVARDAEGNEYTTFRQEIGERASSLRDKPVRIEYHRERRGGYENTYLDAVTPEEPADAMPPGEVADAREAAWRTAVDAAPWLVGDPAKAVPPEELYEKLKPFEERVAADIEEEQAEGET